MLILVDDLQDRVTVAAMNADMLEPLKSRDSRCNTVAASEASKVDNAAWRAAAEKNGGCTLRGAIEMATAVSGTSMILALRGGRFKLAAQLPEITGTVKLLGSLRQGRGDDIDHAYQAARRLGGEGQSAAIGTVIDGGHELQLLRSARGSKLRLENIRLENGRATNAGTEDLRLALGGAVRPLCPHAARFPLPLDARGSPARPGR